MNGKAIFLDRDDTVIEDPGYINSPEQVKLIAGAAAAIADFRKMGYKLIVVSNQSGIARGIITEQALGQIHERLKQLLAEQNAYIDKIYYCPYHPDGVIGKFRKDSDWRKPKPGMILAAAKEMDIDLAESWAIGNSYRDITAGKAAGCRTILIKSSLKIPVKKQEDPDADFDAVNLREAVNIIKREMMPKPVIQPPVSMPEPPKPAEQPQQVPEPEPQIPVQQSEPPQIELPQIKEEKQMEQTEIVEPVKIVQTVQIAKKKPQQPAAEEVSTKTEKLLEDIRLLLKSRNRDELYTEFSIFKLFSGFMQIVVLGCLFIALRYKMSPNQEDSAVYTAIGFAIVFQLMALTLYIMHKDK
jgi:D-glycero-D-manno-heptose 1,7-bisphosphate phosphatase